MYVLPLFFGTAVQPLRIDQLAVRARSEKRVLETCVRRAASNGCPVSGLNNTVSMNSIGCLRQWFSDCALCTAVEVSVMSRCHLFVVVVACGVVALGPRESIRRDRRCRVAAASIQDDGMCARDDQLANRSDPSRCRYRVRSSRASAAPGARARRPRLPSSRRRLRLSPRGARAGAVLHSRFRCWSADQQ